MIFTLYYMYSTLVQWWRLGHLRNKLNGTLNSHNSLLACTGNAIADPQNKRCLENLLFHHEDRIACTVVPKQKVDLSQWVHFPKDLSYFPIYVCGSAVRLRPPSIYLLLQAELDEYSKHPGEVIQVEEFGEVLAWRAQDNFELILKTDIHNLTKIVSCFSDHHLDINHDLKLLRIETVEIEGSPSRIRYDLRYPLEQRTRYSVSPVCWRRFVGEVRALYRKLESKRSDNPKITIVEDPPEKAKSHAKHHKSSRRETKNKLEVATEKRASKPKSPRAKRESRQLNGGVREKRIVVPDIRNGMAESVEVKSAEVNAKPPNVLVFAESSVAKENVKEVLGTILNKEKYVLYDLPAKLKTEVWRDSTILVVVCGNVPPDLTSQLLEYLVSGGNLLCLCSDFLYSVLNIFSTAEVREHELVRFSYENWRRIRMMHHVFCYQASPAKRQFSKDSDQSNHSSRGSSPVAPRTPSVVEIQHNGRKYVVQVQVLGTEETWQTPSLLLASVVQSKGAAVFSQVHLEIDPTQYQDDENKYRALIESNPARLEILKHILSQHLKMDCSVKAETCYAPAYLLGMHASKQEMLSSSESVKDSQAVTEKLTMRFYGKDEEPAPADAEFLPVLVQSSPANFSTVKYFETLTTKEVGRLVIYADVLTSSQTVLESSLKHGLAVIVRQQTRGVGRGGNTWLSPMGCAMFSLQLHIPLDSILGKALSLIQHLVMVSIISVIRGLDGYEDLELGLKWPNDLYAKGAVKIGGLVVNSNVYLDTVVVTIGVGVNLDNVEPTTCINQLVKGYNEKWNKSLAPIGYEDYFALVFNEVERIYHSVQAGDLDSFFDLYYKYWLHGGSEVTVTAANGVASRAKVIGIDEYGYLRIRADDGSIVSVHPDGNTFDMMQGLIAPKVF